MFLEDQWFWILAHVFRGPRIFGSWLMYSEDQGFFVLRLMTSKDQKLWILAHVFRGLEFLDLGSCFQRSNGFGALAHVFGGLNILDPGSCF